MPEKEHKNSRQPRRPKRVLVVVGAMNEPGGYGAVCAWAVQGLARRFTVTVLSGEPIDWARVDRIFGTELASMDVPVVLPWSGLFSAVARLPLRLSLLRLMLLNRAVRRYLSAHPHYDEVIGFLNELDVGRSAHQYIHYPLGIYPRPDADLRWFHWPALLRPYRWLTLRLGGLSRCGIVGNNTLANSKWTAGQYADWYLAPAQTLYPPVPKVADPERAALVPGRFLCVGRMAPEKELEKLIDIVARVREQHPQVSLVLAGARDNGDTLAAVQARVQQYPDWLSVRVDLSRTELEALLVSAEFGIHGMRGEHFGITVAELLRAGKPVFVPDDAGPAEIVDHRRELVYADSEQAVERISGLLADPDARRRVQAFVQQRGQVFSETQFMRRVADIIEIGA